MGFGWWLGEDLGMRLEDGSGGSVGEVVGGMCRLGQWRTRTRRLRNDMVLSCGI